MSERDRTYLIHILECIERIESYVAPGRASFMQEPMAQDATVRNLQVLAESAKRLSEESTSLAPEMDWPVVFAFRNVLVHNYLEIDLEKVWEVIVNDLPPLKEAVSKILGARDWSRS